MKSEQSPRFSNTLLAGLQPTGVGSSEWTPPTGACLAAHRCVPQMLGPVSPLFLRISNVTITLYATLHCVYDSNARPSVHSAHVLEWARGAGVPEDFRIDTWVLALPNGPKPLISENSVTKICTSAPTGTLSVFS